MRKNSHKRWGKFPQKDEKNFLTKKGEKNFRKKGRKNTHSKVRENKLSQDVGEGWENVLAKTKNLWLAVNQLGWSLFLKSDSTFPHPDTFSPLSAKAKIPAGRRKQSPVSKEGWDFWYSGQPRVNKEEESPEEGGLTLFFLFFEFLSTLWDAKH